MARNPILEVLSTPELIALILIHLPLNDLLLTAPLVSPTFHVTIFTTPSLQEALFFRPSLNPTRPIEINPFLKPAFRTHFQPSHRCCGSPEIQNLPWSRNPQAFKRKEASWRKMLLWNGGDPEKIRRVTVMSSVQQMSGTYGRMGYLEEAKGVRMGAVWDLMRRACETEEKGLFCLKWRSDILDVEMGNCELDKPITHGRPSRVSLLNKMRSTFSYREHRIPLQTRYVRLGNRVEEEGDVLEIRLSTWVSCEGKDIFAPSPKGLGEEFQSEGSERVVLEFGEAIRIPDSVAFGARPAAFRRQARRRGVFKWMLN